MLFPVYLDWNFQLLAWHYIFKYNLSVLGTCFECEGVKCTSFIFTWWPWKRSQFKEAEVRRQVWTTQHLRTHLTNKKGKPCHDVHVQRFKDSNERRNWQLFLQAIYFVNNCEAMFSTEQLKISKPTWIKCLLETNLPASSVKPSNMFRLFEI